MSIKTWKKEFYPVPASKIKKWDKIGAIEHCILKWTGTKPENLKAHEVVKQNYFSELIDESAGKEFDFDDSSCALCRVSNGNCNKCPITIATGEFCIGTSCAPYRVWLSTSDPKPMLKVLKKTLRHYKKLEAV